MSYANRNISYSKSYEDEFSWVEANKKKGVHWALCKWCGKDINITSMGRQALFSHSQGTKHQNREKLHTKSLSLTSFIQQKTNSQSDVIPNPPDLSRMFNQLFVFVCWWNNDKN